MAVGIKDVARASGANISAVSLILNGKPHRYSKETERRVLKMAKEMGYRPQAYAQSMRTGKFNQVTIITGADISDQGALHLGLHDALKEKSLRMEHAYLDQDFEEAALTNSLGSIASDGFIVALAGNIPPEVSDFLARQKLPYVWANENREINAVHIRDLEGARFATEQLIVAGHKRISYFEFEETPRPHVSIQERRHGYTEAMVKAQLVPRIIALPTISQVEAYDAFLGNDFWTTSDSPTAFVCYSYKTSWHLVLLAMQRGLRLFEDFVPVSFGAKPHVDDFGLPLPYLKIPFREMGFASVNLLSRMLESGLERIPSVELDLEPHYFDCIAPPPQ